jgi:hypothetical protein
MRAHSRKSSARSVRGDGVTATPNVQIKVIAGAMVGTLKQFQEKCEAVFRPELRQEDEQRLAKVNHPLLGP